MSEIVLTASGIILPSLLIVWMIRRWVETLSWWVAAGFLLITFIVLARPIFTRNMPVALDSVVAGYPYRGIFGQVQPQNPDANDPVKQFLPWMQVVREEIFSGRAPLWNRYSWSGYPLLANGQSAPFSPFFLLTLFVPLPKQIVAMAGLKLFAGLLFGWMFFKREGLSDWTAAFGTSIYALSIFQNIILYYPHTAMTFLFPALGLAALQCVRRPGAHGVILLAVFTACVLTGGHPGMVALCGIGIAFLVLLEMVAPPQPDEKHSKVRGLARVGLGAALGALISAPAWIPVIHQALMSERMMSMAQGRFSAAVYPLGALWSLFNPEGYGNPARGNWSWIFHYIMLSPSYVGLLPLALLPAAVLSPRATRRDRLTLAAIIVLFVVAMSWTALGRALGALVWSGNERARFIMVFLVALVAARGLDRIRAGTPWWEMAGSLIVLLLSGYVFFVKLGTTLSPIHAVGVVGLLAFWIAFLLTRAKTTALVAFIATVLELIVFNWPFNAMVKREYFRPRLPIVDRIHAEAPAEPFRIVGHEWVFLPNASAQYRLEDIRGSDPMAWRDYIEFFRILQVPRVPADVGLVSDIAHPAIAFLNVRYLLAEPNSPFGSPWRLIYRGRDGDLYRHESPIPRFYTAAKLIARTGQRLPDQIEAIEDFRENVVVDGIRSATNPVLPGMWIRQMNPRRFRLTLDATRRTFIASSQPALPGWRVRVNGQATDIHRVNGAFIGFFVPPGKVRVVVEYWPWAYYGSLLGPLLVVVLGVGMSARRNLRVRFGGSPRSVWDNRGPT